MAEPSFFEYWFFQGIEQDGQKYLIGINYNEVGEQQQMNIERILPSGIVLDSLFIFNKINADSIQVVEANIESNVVFPFYPEDSSFVYLKHISWFENPQKKINIIQNRRFLGTEKITIQSGTFETALFGLYEAFETDSIGVLALRSSGFEWYAKNLGLVRQEKQIDGFPVRKLEFTRSMTWDSFKNSIGISNLQYD